VGSFLVLASALRVAFHWRTHSTLALESLERCLLWIGDQDVNHIGFFDAKTRAIFARSYAAEPGVLIKELNQLGVDYNARVIEAILTHVAPALGWR